MKRPLEARPAGGGADSFQAAGTALDGGVVASSALLLCVGVVMSFSATAPLALDATIPPLFLKHLAAVLAGATLAMLAAWMPISFWKRSAWPLALGSLVLLAITPYIGIEANGARRWLAVPGLGFRFQPAELVRVFTLMAVVSLVGTRDGRGARSRGRVIATTVLATAAVLMLLLQPDLGSAVLLAALVWIVLFAGGTPLRTLLWPALGAPFAIGLYAYANPYAWRRLVAFWDPWKDSQDAGFQLVQSFLAFHAGGIGGVGLGNGRQKLFYLPEAHTDFILALIAEELGLIGVLVVLGAFAALCVAGLRIARRAGDRFSSLLALAMTGIVVLPAVVNASVVMGLLPTTGLTLPFLSYGRTSLISCCFAVGVLLGVARATKGREKSVGGEPWR